MINEETKKNLQNMLWAYCGLFGFLVLDEDEVEQYQDMIRREVFKGYTEEDKRIMLIYCENSLKAVENKKSCTGYPYDPRRMRLYKEMMEMLIRRLNMMLASSKIS